jgi:transcriptional regulator with XRE-family HTH domain
MQANSKNQAPSAPLARQFGNRLDERAHDLGLKGSEVARRAGIEPKTYNNYVRGERQPDLQSLVKIAAVLETSVDALLDPAAVLRARDARTFRAEKSISAACLELDYSDMHVVADVARALGARRRERYNRFNYDATEVIRRLALVHQELIPEIIRSTLPRLVDTQTIDDDDNGNARILIGCLYDPKLDRETIDRTKAAIRNLIQRHLHELGDAASPEPSLHREHDRLWISARVYLGPALPPASPKKKVAAQPQR